MASFNNTSYQSPPPTKAERRENAAAATVRAKVRIASQTERSKIQSLGRAIARAFVERGSVNTLDLVQAGFAEAEAKRLYNDALAFAQRIEPAMRTAA